LIKSSGFKAGFNRIDVIVSVLVSSAVDREFESRSDQTKDYKIVICCFSSNTRVNTLSWSRYLSLTWL